MPISNVTFVKVTNSAPGGFDFYNVRGVKIVDSQFNDTLNNTFTLCNAEVSISNSMAPRGPVYIGATRGSNALALSYTTAFMQREGLSTIKPLTLNGGVLSTAGNLELSGSSVVNFVVGRAESKVIAGGGLRLDGKINISGGSGFKAGSYNLFEYHGDLTGEAVLGSTPASYQCRLDTNTAGRVRLFVK
jgi:hypothetical protein